MKTEFSMQDVLAFLLLSNDSCMRESDQDRTLCIAYAKFALKTAHNILRLLPLTRREELRYDRNFLILRLKT